MVPNIFRSARLCSGALALVLLTGAPVFAQTATTPPAENPPAASAPAANTPIPTMPSVPQPEPTAEQLAAARDVVNASGIARSFEPMEPELEAQIVPLMTRTRPELVGDLKEVLTQLHPEFVKDAQAMVDIAARIFAQQMKLEDLKATATFFNSPSGKEYVRVQPIMLDQLVVQMQSWTQQLSNTMMLRVRQEMIKKGHTDF